VQDSNFAVPMTAHLPDNCAVYWIAWFRIICPS